MNATYEELNNSVFFGRLWDYSTEQAPNEKYIYITCVRTELLNYIIDNLPFLHTNLLNKTIYDVTKPTKYQYESIFNSLSTLYNVNIGNLMFDSNFEYDIKNIKRYLEAFIVTLENVNNAKGFLICRKNKIYGIRANSMTVKDNPERLDYTSASFYKEFEKDLNNEFYIPKASLSYDVTFSK